MDAHLFIEFSGVLITVIVAVVSAIWLYEQYNQKRVETIWNRIDEKQKLYFETFLKREIYENDQKHFKELREEKDNSLMRFFSDKFNALEASMLELKQAFKDSNNKGHNGHE